MEAGRWVDELGSFRLEARALEEGILGSSVLPVLDCKPPRAAALPVRVFARLIPTTRRDPCLLDKNVVFHQSKAARRLPWLPY